MRDAARTSQCSGNLRHLQLANAAYTTDIGFRHRGVAQIAFYEGHVALMKVANLHRSWFWIRR